MRRAGIALVVLSLAMAGCGNAAESIAEQALEGQGGENVDVEVDEDGGAVSVEFEDEEGEGSATFGGGEIPDDFPIPVPGGGTILQVVDLPDGTQSVSVQYDVDRFDSLSEEFVGFFDGFGDTQTSTGTGEDPFLNLISADAKLSVSLIGTPEGVIATLVSQP